MNTLQHFCDSLERLCLLLSSAGMASIVFVGTAEIMLRCFGRTSIHWGQEVITLCLGVSVFLAAPVVFRRKRDSALCWFRKILFPEYSQLLLDFFFLLLAMVFLFVLLFFSLRLQFLQARASSAFLGIGMNWFSFPVTLFSAVTQIFLFERLAVLLCRERNRRDQG